MAGQVEVFEQMSNARPEPGVQVQLAVGVVNYPYDAVAFFGREFEQAQLFLLDVAERGRVSQSLQPAVRA